MKEDIEDGVKIIIRNVGNSPNSTSSHPTKTLNPQKNMYIMVLLVNDVIICVLFLRVRRHKLSPFSGRNFHPILKMRAASLSETFILYKQRDATCTIFSIIISALRVSSGFSAHHQELIKLYVQPWALSCFPAVYR